MGTQYPRVPFLFIMVMLTFTQLSNCHDMKRVTIEGTEMEFKPEPEFRSPFSTHFPAAVPIEAKNDGVEPIYGMSDRTVPGGPDPLHNWLASKIWYVFKYTKFCSLQVWMCDINVLSMYLFNLLPDIYITHKWNIDNFYNFWRFLILLEWIKQTPFIFIFFIWLVWIKKGYLMCKTWKYTRSVAIVP